MNEVYGGVSSFLGFNSPIWLERTSLTIQLASITATRRTWVVLVQCIERTVQITCFINRWSGRHIISYR